MALFDSLEGERGINLTLARHELGPRMFFYDEEGQPHAIQIHAITQLQEEVSGSITEFPVEGGGSITDNVIHFPSILKLDIVQTEIPVEGMEDDGQLVEFEKGWIDLDVKPNNFVPKGLLLVTQAARSGVQAIGSALGVGPEPVVARAEVWKPDTSRSYINNLREALLKAQEKAYPMELLWLNGTSWGDYFIESVSYVRSNDMEAGRFSVTLKHVKRVAAIQSALSLADPFELRHKPEKNAGNVPSPKLNADEADSAKKSLAASGLDAAAAAFNP